MVGLAAACLLAGYAAGGQPEPLPAILLADTSRTPVVQVSWQDEAGRLIELEGERGYTSPAGTEVLGGNLSAYVALGGTRLDRGAAHPRGAVLRVGVYKTDARRPFFEGIGEGGSITIRVRNLAMNRPVKPWPASIVMHLKYMPDELAACGLGASSSVLFYTTSRTDTLNGKITPETGRLGILSSANGSGATVSLTGEDRTVEFTATIPYGLLRHMSDPWLRTAPGTFLEPTHFHFEFEVLPPEVAEAIGDPEQRARPYPEAPFSREEPAVGPSVPPPG